VVARDKEIHLLFDEKDQAGNQQPAYTANFVLSATDALVFSTLLADLAFEAETALKPAGPALKAELVERHRVKLINRLTLIFNDQREKRTIANRALAKRAVEVMLAEVFN
jgi:hypothetical protein